MNKADLKSIYFYYISKRILKIILGPILTGILVKVSSSVFYLFSGLIWKRIIPNKVNYHLIFFRTVFSILFSLLTIFTFNYFHISNISYSSFLEADLYFWLLTLCICFFSFYGLYFFTNALKNGRYSIVTPFVSTAAIFSFITSLIIYDENISLFSTVAFFTLTITLIAHQFKNFKTLRFSKEIFLTLLCSFFWGVSFVLYPIPIKKFGILNFSLILEICVLISCIYLIIFKERKILPSSINKQEIMFCSIIGLCVAGGNITANFSLQAIPIYLNIVISVIFEAAMLIIGIKLFKEQLKKKDWALILAITVCSILTFF